MITSKTVKVVLDKERSITYDNRADFRMGSLDRPFTLADLRIRKRSWAALVAWVWACLDPRDAQDFAAPEDLSYLIKDEATLAVAFAAFLETYNAGSDDPPKNDKG